LLHQIHPARVLVCGHRLGRKHPARTQPHFHLPTRPHIAGRKLARETLLAMQLQPAALQPFRLAAEGGGDLFEACGFI
jgi:hypothetical protein